MSRLIKTALQELPRRMDDAKRFISADSRQMQAAA
jgi:hypothetical protein